MAPDAQAKNPMAWDKHRLELNGKSDFPGSIKNGMIQIPVAYLSKELLLRIVNDLVKFCSLDKDLRELSAISSVENDKTNINSFKVQGKELATSDPKLHVSVRATDQMDERIQKFEISRKKSREFCMVKKKLKNCSYCNKPHFWSKNLCSSYGKRCTYCNILNHCEDACYWKHPELLENNNRHFVERNLKENAREKLKTVKIDEASESSSHRNSETSMLGIIKDLHRGSPKETTKSSDEVAEKAKFSEERKAVTETTDEKEGKAVKHKSSRKGKDGKKRQKAKKKASKRSNEGINSVLKDKQVEPLEKECIELNDKAKVLQPEKADEERILQEELDVKADAVHDNLVREQKNLEATDVDEWKELYAWSEREAIKDEASRQERLDRTLRIHQGE